ncbi:MAG TPA: xylulokinase [Clostridiaceae bacterium]|nr:xylulokinase [Clostridiaceae bacterium]
MDYLLGIDLGTSATKSVLFDKNGVVLASSTATYTFDQPKNGWAEQDPDVWWRAVCQTTNDVVSESGIDAAHLKGIGISGQMHGVVMLDENGDVIRKSILWNDGRTAEECAEITDIIGAERLIQITANPALVGFSAGKILWVRRHEPENFARCRHILLPKDYIRYKLTGVFATEVSDASGMNLLDIRARTWSDEILSKLGIEKEWLGDVYESVDITGEVTAAAAAGTGLHPGTPVVGGAGDNAAAAIGVGVYQSGRAMTTIGTSGVVYAHSDTLAIEPQGRIHTFCSAVPGAWAVMSCTLSAGLSLQWFRNTCCEQEIAEAKESGTDPYDLMNRLAASSPVGANRLLFLPYLMGERSPLLDEHARGVFMGLSAMHTKGDLIRAVMEGVSYSQRQCFDILSGMGLDVNDMTICGGGARSPLWLQMLSDLYGCTVKTTSLAKEGPALGVAILAGVGTGVYESIEEAWECLSKTTAETTPDEADRNAYEPYYALYKSLYPVLQESFLHLACIQ